ncbi:hypothetical protein TNCV_4864471 [Trichonephila clavipes]|nr:hypothetical protein TNCV_4864471 [Trichonephila clavipes]
MGLRIGIATFADIPQELVSLLSAAPFKRYQLPQVILTPSFFPRGRHLSSVVSKFVLRNLILLSQTDTRGIFHAIESYDMAVVDFLHQKNPPTWARLEPATNQRFIIKIEDLISHRYTTDFSAK